MMHTSKTTVQGQSALVDAMPFRVSKVHVFMKVRVSMTQYKKHVLVTWARNSIS